MHSTVISTKPAESDVPDSAQALKAARARFDAALELLENTVLDRASHSEKLEKACNRASEELALHIRNLGRIVENQS